LKSKSPDSIEHLRHLFLSESTSGVSNYWDSEETLAAYEETLAQRILWKWQGVLETLNRRNLLSKFSTIESVVDWGCGSGVASRALLDALAKENVSLSSLKSWNFWDRSELATKFAENLFQKCESKNTIASVPVFRARCEKMESAPLNSAVLISHVLSEMNSAQQAKLTQSLENASVVLWIEAGTRTCSQALLKVRENLRNKGFVVLAPCTQNKNCPLNDSLEDWCHMYAPVPSFVFQSAFWSQFSKKHKVDLRALPLSFLMLARNSDRTDKISDMTIKNAKNETPENSLCSEQNSVSTPNSVQLGRIRAQGKSALLTLCDGDKVENKIITAKELKKWEKSLSKQMPGDLIKEQC
jgi:ribosomal protein RSM22 (predicted rRNA methylase)